MYDETTSKYDDDATFNELRNDLASREAFDFYDLDVILDASNASRFDELREILDRNEIAIDDARELVASLVEKLRDEQDAIDEASDYVATLFDEIENEESASDDDEIVSLSDDEREALDDLNAIDYSSERYARFAQAFETINDAISSKTLALNDAIESDIVERLDDDNELDEIEARAIVAKYDEKRAKRKTYRQERRARETTSERDARLEKNKIARKIRRDNESESEKRARLDARKTYRDAKRASETSDEKQARLDKRAAYRQDKRDNETSDEKRARLAKTKLARDKRNAIAKRELAQARAILARSSNA